MSADAPYLGEPIADVRDKLVAGASWMSGLHLIAKAIDLVVLVVLARLLSPEAFGVVAAAYVFIEFARLFSEIGVGPALVQLPQLTRFDVRTASTLVLLSAASFFVAAQFAAPIVALAFAIPDVEPAVRALSFLFLAQALGVTSQNLLIRRLRARDVMAVQALNKIVGAGGVAIVCALSGFGYWSLIYGALVESFLNAIMLFALQRPPSSPLMHGPSVRRILGRGVGYSTARIVNFGALQGDNVIAGRILGADGLGVYSRAYRLMSIPADLYTQVAERLVFPAFAQFQGDPARLRRAFLSGLSLTAVVGLPLSALLYMLGPDIVTVALGAKWESVIAPFTILALASYFRLGAKICGSLINARAALREMILVQILYATSVIGLGVLAAPHGVMWLAASTSLSVFIFFCAISVTACRAADVRLIDFAAAHAHGLALGAATAGLTWLALTVLHQVGAPPLVRLIGCVGVAMVFAVALAGWSPPFLVGASTSSLLQSVRGKILKGLRLRVPGQTPHG